MKIKSQSAVELMIVIGVLLFFFVSAVFFFQANIQKRTIEKRNLAVYELGSIVQNEIDLASSSIDGYERTFNIPDEILNINYTITLTEGVVYIQTEDEKIALALPVKEVTGQIQKGDNIIKKINGEVLLNQ